MKNFIAIMQTTPENRLAKYLDFDTVAEAQAHIEKHITKYPDAFVHPIVTGSLNHWLIDMVAKTIIFSPDSLRLDREVKQAIRSECMKRLQEFMEDADFEIAASIHLLFIRAEGTTWTAAEQSMANGLKIKFNYVRELYVAVTQGIAGIPSMTETDKLTFDPVKDITWPVAE